jgi:transposase
MTSRETLRASLAELSREELVERALDLEQRLRETEERLAEAQAQIAELRRQLFGSKAEKLSAEQQAQMDELASDLQQEAQKPPPLSQEVLEEERRDQRRRRAERRPPRHPVPPVLETETVTLELAAKEKLCPHCGRQKQRIGEEVTEETDLIPAKLIRRRTVRPKYACRCGEAGVVIAPLPPRLIPQSQLGLGLAVHLLLARYDDHLSFYTLERIFRERHAVEISRQQIVQWVEHIAGWLQPVYDAMWKTMKAGGYVQIDETPVKVLDPEVKGKAAQGYLWFFAAPRGDAILEFSRSRGQQVPRRKLEGFVGTIQTDAYGVYQALERKDAALRRIGCLAHTRRGFYQALRESVSEAVWFIAQIRQLYRLEDQIRQLEPAGRCRLRQQCAPEIWEAMKARAEELQPKLLPKSTLGKAVNYFLNEYAALVGYLADGRFEIDNNLVENDIRPTAVGRKRWLFIGHPDAGWRSAVIYSILISCRRRGLNPQEYLTDVLARLPAMKITQIHELLPAQWKPPSASNSPPLS